MQRSDNFIRHVVSSGGRTARAIVAGWNTFLYSPRDPLALGFLRLFVGGMLFYTHLIWGLELNAFLGPDGWNNAAVVTSAQTDWWAPSFWWYVSEPWMMTAHCVCLIILLAFWAGLATPLTSVLSLGITISYAYRAHMANFGLDQINTILCFYLCLGPSGARLSVDRLLQVWWWKRRTTGQPQRRAAGPPRVLATSRANLAVRLIQLHFCVIYLYAGFSKLQGAAWWSGEAVWLAFANREYQSLDMTWMAWYPWICELMTHTTIVWEVSFAAAVWVRPLRTPVLALGFLLHLGIGGMMGMWTFGLIMIFGHIAFWPESTIRRCTGWVPRAERLLQLPVPADAALSESLRPTAQEQSRGLPRLLCVNRNLRQLLQCLNYFSDRGFRCLASASRKDAHRLRVEASPEAVVLMAEGMSDEAVVEFQQQHYQVENAEPLFLVLSDTQAERLNGSVAHGPGTVLAGRVSLGALRRSIQGQLEAERRPERQPGHQPERPLEHPVDVS